MKISIIIPVYNPDSDYLRNCLDSCLDQTIAEAVEVIAVNDGSTNGCDKILAEYSKKYELLTVITQKNQGTSVARNAGLDKACGDYIMFVDADDWIERDCCENALRAAYNSNSDITFFGYATNYTNRQMNRVIEKPNEKLFERDILQLAILEGNPELGAVEVGAPWGKLIRHSVIEKNHVRYTPGLKKGQDTVFVLNLLEHCRTFSYFSYLGYHYRMSGASISHRYNPEIVSIMEKTLKAYSEFVNRYGKNERFREAVARKYYRVMTGEYIMLDFCHPDNKESGSASRKRFKDLLGKEPYKSSLARVGRRKPHGYDGLIFLCAKTKNIPLLFALKKLEIAVRNIVIHQYG